MKFAFKSALALLAGLAVSSGYMAACGGYPELLVDKGFDPGADAGPEVDAAPPTLGPSLVVDDMHIASFMEAQHAFALLGMLLNPQLKMGIDNGTMLLGMEMRSLDDPSGQSDPEFTIGLYNVTDADNDPANNFNPDSPGAFNATGGPGGMNNGPLISYTKVSVADGNLHAEGIGSLGMMPNFPLPFGGDQTLDGRLVPTQDNEHIRTLEDGRMVTVLAASTLSNLPNIAGSLGGMGGMGGMQCGGDTFLDAIATGCGFFPFQPDSDIDGDGLEKLFDTEGGDPDAGTLKDGRIDKCVDGDGTEILGVDCVSDPRIQDGYKLIFVVHGVRAIVYVP